MAYFRKRETVELGHVFRESFENVLDVVDFVAAAGKGEDEIAEDFPIIMGQAGEFDGTVQALEAAG